MGIVVKFKKDYRTFKKDEIFEFEDNTVIIGSNGSGKSSLLNLIRSSWPGHYMGRVSEWEDIVTVIIPESYTNFYDYHTEDDAANGKSFADMNYLLDVGLGIMRASSGQAQLEQISQLLIKIAKDKPIKGLVTFDEPESSLDLKTVIKLVQLLVVLNVKFKTDILMTTHSETLLRRLSRIWPVYDLDQKRYISTQEVTDLIDLNVH